MTRSKSFYTQEDYLFLDRKAEYKNEYRAGKMVPMVSGNRFHNIIVTNFIAILVDHLKDSDPFCANRMRVKTPDSLFYTYPDLLVSDYLPRFEDELEDTLLNPMLLVEVVSESTESYDRTIKFANYRQIESLKEYILIAQYEYRITQYFKDANGSWIFREATSIDETIPLNSIRCPLDLQTVYNKVNISAQDLDNLFINPS